MKPQLRAEAARTLARVFAGESLDQALTDARRHFAEPRDQALLQALCYGVLRDRRLLEALVRQMLQKPLDAPLAEALLLVGLHQLRSMRIAAHAAVAETVAATTALQLQRLRGLVNALLRRYQREHEALEAALPRAPAIRYAYPDWLVERIRRDWPDEWPALLAAGNERAPLTLRVNRRRLHRDAYLARLAEAGIGARAPEGLPDAVVLDDALPVERIPGFEAGDVSVQDAAAQLAVELLDLRDGLRVLDACAAPGGKAAHQLERAAISLVALDRDEQRLRRVGETFARLGLQGELRAADAADTASWWDGRPFDRILIDAPCSGTGVIRRHPDIKWLRRESDIARLAEEQLRLLRALWPLLAPGGILLFATCSILQDEGEGVARRFLQAQPEAKHLPVEAAWGRACRLGRRLPAGGDFDGFYYVRYQKPAPHAPLAAPRAAA